MKKITQKDTNLYYVRTFMSLMLIISFIRSKKNISSFNTLIINYQYFSRKIIYKCTPFLKNYFHSIEYIKYKRNSNYSPSNFFKYCFRRSQEIKRFSKILEKIILKYNVKNIYTGGDDIEFAISKIKNTRISTYYIEHGHGNLAEAIISVQKFRFYQYFYKLIILILFKLNIFYYGPNSWKGYVTILGNRFTNKFFKKNLIRSACLHGFSPFVKKLVVKPKHINLEIDRLTESLKIKKPSKKNYILLNFGGSHQHQDLNQFKILIKKILNIVDKKKDIILIKEKQMNNDPKASLQKTIVKILIKQKIKIIYWSHFPISSLPSEVVIRLFNIKKIISEISTVAYFSEILFKNTQIYVFKNFFLSNKNQPSKDKVYKVINLYEKKFKKINFY